MLPIDLQRFLRRHIPLAKAMDVSVVAVEEDAVTLRAPLAPNINHSGTVFGGSASTLAILAAWSLVHTRLSAAGIDSRLVIRRNVMEYEAPILGDFTARAALEEPQAWQQFLQTLERRGKARMSVAVLLEHAGQVVGRFTGEFVALGRSPASATGAEA